MKQLVFKKIKTTSGFLFKPQQNKVTFTDNSIDVSTFPFFIFSGKYFIHSIEKENNVYTVYKVMKALDNELEPNFDNLFFDEWHIYVAKTGRKIMLYNDSKEGIILKA